ncbi:MAG: thioredoxin domain-containing protein [Polyangiaceae bacterium]|nr:thioredoxin domain-containing protein [Polyangiaceae bacterium]
MEELEAGSVFGEDYEIVRAIYTGGLSTIYEAKQRSTGDRRALKVVHGALGKDEKIRSAFLEEAKRASQIQSPHVAEVVAWGCDPETGHPFAALELLEGKRLSQYLDENGPMSPAELLGFLRQLGHALAAAHAVHVVHRDLKPEGIMLAASPTEGLAYRVEVQFVGVGKIASEIRENTTAAMSRGLWMAPEQAETNARPTPATDVWTIGLLAFWLVTGKHYWKTARDMGSAMVTLMREVLFDPIVPASKRAAELGVERLLPPGFDAWFAQCVSRDPARRFQNAWDAVRALEVAAAAWPRPATTAIPGSATQAPQQERAKPADAAAAAAAAAARPVMFSIPGQHSAVEPQRPAAPSAVEVPGAAAPPAAPPPAIEESDEPAPAPIATSGGDDAAKPAPRAPSRGAKTARLVAGLVVAAVVSGVGGYYANGAYKAYQRKVKREEAAREDAEREAEREAKREEAKRKKKMLEEWSDLDGSVPISFADPSTGSRTAPVTIVEFTDFQCKPCRNLEKTLNLLKLEYPPTDLRVVWKNWPLPAHDRGKAAAQAGIAVFKNAKSDGFFKFATSAFLSESDELYDFELQGWARDAGVNDFSKYLRDAESLETTKKVEADLALGRTLGVRRAPTLFINGLPLEGDRPIEELRKVIEEQRQKGKSEADKGTDADKVYVALTKEQFATVPRPQPAPPDPNAMYRVPLDRSPALGKSDAPVTAVLFADVTSPDCAALYKTIEGLKATYGDRLRIVWKDRPLETSARSVAAANFLREARALKDDELFWKAAALLFEHQTALEDGDLKGYAKTLKVSATKTVDAVTSLKHNADIAKDEALAELLDVDTVPQLFINGKRVVGNKSAADIGKLIDDAETDAKSLTARGVAATAVYDELMKTARPDTLDLRIVDPGFVSYMSPRLGAPYAATVVVQQFCDYESPDCKKMAPVLKKLSTQNPDKVVIHFRYLPLPENANARTVAMAGAEMKTQCGDPCFFDFVDVWYAQHGTNPPDFRAALGKAAAAAAAKTYSVTFDGTAFESAIDTKKHNYTIGEDEKAAEALGITEVPTYVVGKYLFTGAISEQKFQALVDRVATE